MSSGRRSKRADEFAAVRDGRIVVMDGRDHVALGSEILGQPGHRRRVVAVTVGYDDQREALAGGGRVADRESRDAEACGRQGRLRRELRRIHGRRCAGFRQRGVPEIDGEIANTQRRLAARGIERQHVGLRGFAQMQRPDAHRMAAERRELGRVDAESAGRRGLRALGRSLRRRLKNRKNDRSSRHRDPFHGVPGEVAAVRPPTPGNSRGGSCDRSSISASHGSSRGSFPSL